ncbi:hypothetical protein [Shewanella donghaensis]|uniref:hypothetical protein n=1 Tax=Shewanella donghaensis TaxID=238836 RepID=UPI0011835EBA|nr:hypothetical protein [Shewanella donghaensis]
MYNHLLSQPIKYEVNQQQTLYINLPDGVSDFAILPALSQPIAEFVVNELIFDQSNKLIKAYFILTCQPLFVVSVVDKRDKQEPNPSLSLDPRQLKRSLGQGFRLYTRTGLAPKFSAAMLRQGVSLDFLFDDNFSIVLSEQVCEAIQLENDFRLNQEPKELMMAKAILARNFDYQDSPAIIAINISEIELVRADISSYLSEDINKVHAVIAAQLLKLDNLLNHKQQWLLRTYSQSQQRTNYASAANELTKDVEDLQRKLECFSLLAPADVSLMVDKLTEDN